MYDFYPEWGPARHRDENEQTPDAGVPATGGAGASCRCHRRHRCSAGAEARDADRERPDDN